jgi:formylglycine-generating enzyme required for sulfatase activity
VPALFAQLLDELLYQEGRTPEQEQRDLLLAAELAEDAGWYRLERGGAAFKRLRRDLAAALVPVVEGTTLTAKERVQAGVYLGWLGDPRPGVCTLPPDMVRIEGGEFVIGILPEEVDAFVAQMMRENPGRKPEQMRDAIQQNWTNTQSLLLSSFEIARYPLTNAQWKLFIDDNGYEPDQSWWDDAGRAWLLRDDHATQGLVRWQKRRCKRYPEWWHRERYGITRPNHPVFGVSWYEAVAFCRWITQHQGYNPEGYVYILPSEAEWEYTARRSMRRAYPWGNEEPDAERTNFDQVYDGTTAVGCFAWGATPEDQIHDMAGNVWEWTRSLYQAYPYDPNDGREEMVVGDQNNVIVRGGGWYPRSDNLRASYRGTIPPDYLRLFVGCRLVRYPSDKA